MDNSEANESTALRPPKVLERMLGTFGRCEILPFRLRRNLIRRFIDDRTVASRPFQVNFHGLSYTGNLNTLIDWYVFFFGGFEKYMLAFMADFARRYPGCIYLDVGANTGQHVLFMSRLAGKVHAFEPWTEALAVLDQQIAVNDLTNVVVHRCALGDQSFMGAYYPPDTSNRGVGSFVESFSEAKSATPLEYPVRKGDEAIEQEVGPFDLVKIDTEGYEVQVMAGLISSFVKNRPTIIVELSHHTDVGFRDLNALKGTLPDNYRLFGIRGVHNGYRYRFCELTPDNWQEFLDVVALPEDEVGELSDRIRRLPFYSKPSDILRILKAWFSG
jgi:FkbM family methyltransferase